MPVNTDYQRALALAKAGELEKAQAILLGLEDEQSERLLEKVNKAIAARGSSQQVSSQAVAQGIKQANEAAKQAKAKQTGMGCLVFLAIACICSMVITLSLPKQPEASISEVCDWVVMTSGQHCTPERILRDYRPMVDACYSVWSSANTYNIVDWMNCLENKSVDLLD